MCRQRDNDLDEAVKRWDQVVTLLESSDVMEEEKEEESSSLTGYFIVDQLCCEFFLPCIWLTTQCATATGS